MSDEVEQAAQRIAERGREALLARLRPTFEQAAARYEDAIELDAGQLERMVQAAAARADGLQWRRALAGVGTEELGIPLGEALSHPAVERAQAIVGAPSYEDSLAALTAGAPAPPERASPERASPSPERPGAPPEADTDITATSPDDTLAAPDRALTGSDDALAQSTDQTPQALRLAAVHMGGIGNLASGEGSLELRFSDAGLDIVRSEDGSTVGRLGWGEIEGLDIPAAPGGLRRRRRRSRAQLLVRTELGEAQFEIPGITDAELTEHLAPMLARTRGAGDSD